MKQYTLTHSLTAHFTTCLHTYLLDLGLVMKGSKVCLDIVVDGRGRKNMRMTTNLNGITKT